jgi:hypothetical protein
MARADQVVTHAELGNAYHSRYGLIPKRLTSDKYQMRLVRGQFLEVLRTGWPGVVLIPYANVRGTCPEPDKTDD